MTYKKFMSLFLIAGSIASTLCSCAATDSSAVVGYIDEHPITMEEFNYFLSQQKSSVCQSYSQLYGITSFDSAFWNNEYGDSTPLDSATVIPLAEVRNRITDYLLNSRISTETELIQNRLVFTETDAFQNTSIE